MSGTEEPPVHVDTPEQAAARQLIETTQRVTHVASEEEAAPPATADFSLTTLAPKPPAATNTTGV